MRAVAIIKLVRILKNYNKKMHLLVSYFNYINTDGLTLNFDKWIDNIKDEEGR